MNFKELCEINGIHLKPEHFEKLEIYKNLLKKWGRRINLTSVLSDREIELRHFLDSLLGLKAFKAFGLDISKKSIADVGSGAGFPGVPLAVVIDSSDFDLIESRHKRCVFLEQVKRELKLKNIKVVCERVENVDSFYNVLLMRAVKDPRNAVKIVKHLLKKGAVLCIYRGKGTFNEKMEGYFTQEIEIPVEGLNVRRRFLFIWRSD
jgi:16S rRNA (guanine527-N7)-methyltransferase